MDTTPALPSENIAHGAHLARWRFKPGNIGRPKGSVSGRTSALLVLDRLLTKAGNKKKLEVSLQREFNRNPASFFRNYVMPLLPREAILKAGGEGGVVRWVSLLDSVQAQDTGDAPPIDVPSTDVSQ